jgi:hypothetical protein
MQENQTDPKPSPEEPNIPDEKPPIVSPLHPGEAFPHPVGSVISPNNSSDSPTQPSELRLNPLPAETSEATEPTPPKQPLIQPSAPAHVVGTGGITLAEPKKSKFKKIPLKLVLMILIPLVVLCGGVSAFYYGYYMNPSVIWSQSLSNTNKGYNQLISYANTQSQTTYKGLNLNGNLSFQASGVTYSGNFSFKNYNSNSTGTLKLNLGPTSIDLESRVIAHPGSGPDVYLQVNGIKNLGFGSLLGIDQNAINSLDGQWILIDHSLLSNLTPTAKPSTPSPSNKDVVNAAKEFGTINSQYIFTTNQAYSVTKVVKKLGFQTINGIKTYHYKIGFNKQNVKSYITALRNGFQQSALGAWATKDTGESINTIMGYDDLENRANNLSNSDTLDVWINVNSRVIYKVRVDSSSNPVTDYVEVGLNKITGSNYPFFFDYSNNSNGSNIYFSITSTLNTANNSIGSVISGNIGDTKISGNLGIQPTNTSLTVTAPTNSISLQKALGELGLTNLYNSIISGINTPSQTQPSGIAPSLSLFSPLLQRL